MTLLRHKKYLCTYKHKLKPVFKCLNVDDDDQRCLFPDWYRYTTAEATSPQTPPSILLSLIDFFCLFL